VGVLASLVLEGLFQNDKRVANTFVTAAPETPDDTEEATETIEAGDDGLSLSGAENSSTETGVITLTSHSSENLTRFPVPSIDPALPPE